MDQTDSARDLLTECQGGVLDPEVIDNCFTTHGHAVEVLAARSTPAHPGVPYVLVDGEPLDDPFSIQKAICDRLKLKLSRNSSTKQTTLPKACEKSTAPRMQKLRLG